LLIKPTLRPAAGASDEILTVAVEVRPPVTEVGLKLSSDNFGALTKSFVCTELDPAAASTPTLVSVATGDVSMAKVAEVLPAGTETDAASVATPFVDVSDTSNPPAGAFFDKLTVPVAEVPPTTLAGLTLTLLTVCAALTPTRTATRQAAKHTRTTDLREPTQARPRPN